MRELSRERLQWQKLFEEDEEYYTNKRGKEFIDELVKYMTRYTIDLVASYDK